MEPQKTLNRQRNLEKEEQKRRFHVPVFKLYYKAIVIKTVSYWQKIRKIDQWNRIKSHKVSPFLCAQLIFNKGCKNIQWEKQPL